METPFTTNIGRGSASSTYHEWQTEDLPTADGSNARISGDDASVTAAINATRIGNYTQISDKVASVSGTDEATIQAGIKSSMARQVALQMRALKRDMETILLSNQASSAGSASAARNLGGAPAWLVSNTSFGGGAGADPTGTGTSLGTTARTDGTQRVFTEEMLATVQQSCWTNGGNPDMVLMGAFNKRKASGFTGVATKYKDADDKRIVASADVWEGDFGQVMFVPNRFQRSRDVFVIDPEMWEVAYLRPVRDYPLAKNGDYERRQIITEYTLKCKNEKASGGIFDLTDS